MTRLDDKKLTYCFPSHCRQGPCTRCRLEYNLLQVREVENAIRLWGSRSCPGAGHVTVSHPSSLPSQLSPEYNPEPWKINSITNTNILLKLQAKVSNQLNTWNVSELFHVCQAQRNKLFSAGSSSSENTHVHFYAI